MAGVGEVAALQVQTSGAGAWVSAVTKWGGMWELNMPGPGPYNLQMTLVDGQTVRF